MGAKTMAALAFAGALALGACDTATTRPLQLTMVNDGLIVAVSPSSGSANPSYSWTGGSARLLEVSGLDAGGLVWRVQALDDAGFGDPVRHGVVPPGGTQNGDAVLLEADARYRLRVVTVDGTEGTFDFIP